MSWYNHPDNPAFDDEPEREEEEEEEDVCCPYCGSYNVEYLDDSYFDTDVFFCGKCGKEFEI